jgi:hypothetical protein
MRAGAGVAIVLVVTVVVGPVILGRSPLSPFDLLVLAAIVLGAGLLMRSRGTGSTRKLGSALAIVGVVLVMLVVGFIWLLTQGLDGGY